MKTPKRFTQRPRRKRKERGAPKRQRSIQRQRPKRKEQGAAGALKLATDDPPFLKFWKQANKTLPETIGKADLSRLNKALKFLFNRLREARKQFEQEGDNGRQGACTALSAFWQFITLFEKPLEETLHVPILRLHDALAGLDEGRTEPIVKAVRRRGGAPSSHAYDSIKGHAVATVQLLQLAGLTRDDARRVVAKQLSKLGVRPERGSGPVTATTLRNWGDKVSSDFGRHSTAAMVHDNKLIPEERERFLASPKDRKQFALRLLATYVRSISPGQRKPT
jgi:hypothetical protein